MRARALLLSVLVMPLLTAAEELRPFLNPLFGDHAVVQRGRRLPVGGWTTPGAEVTVRIGGKTAIATATGDGAWTAWVGPFTTEQGPLDLVVDGPAHAEAHDLLAGEVWLCSGQSNMSWTLAQTDDGPTAVETADHPRIRLYNVPSSWALDPKVAVPVSWAVCTPETAADFSGVAYHFGRELQERLGGVPIGLISAAFSGAAAECFMSPAAIARFGEFSPLLNAHAKVHDRLAAGRYDIRAEMASWWSQVDALAGPDRALEGFGLTTDSWEAVPVPGPWQEHGHPRYHGFVWYRRSFDCPPEAAGKPARLDLGPIDDRDTTWINGHVVGEMANWVAPRHYDVPAGVLRAGRNDIAVRVLDLGGSGGFTGRREELALKVAGLPDLSLAGVWRLHQTLPLERLPLLPVDYDWPMRVPSLQYQAMIHPLEDFPLAGVAWYQGESNGDRPGQYRRLLPALIADWRDRWHDPDLPFLLVQIAGIAPAHDQPVCENPWAATMEAQAETARAVPRVGLATAADLGFDHDIHPKDKRTVAHRLVFPALSMVYGRTDLVAGSPVAERVERRGTRVRIHFRNAGRGLQVVGKTLAGFALVGRDGTPVWAESRLQDRDTVEVWSDRVPEPERVLFNFDNHPEVRLANPEGLPAIPFRATVPTDVATP